MTFCRKAPRSGGFSVVHKRYTTAEAQALQVKRYKLYRDTCSDVISNRPSPLAALARRVSVVVITYNKKHFRRVSGLSVENWVRSPKRVRLVAKRGDPRMPPAQKAASPYYAEPARRA